MPEREASPATAPSLASFAEWCHLACSGPVVRRGLKFAVVVGSILITINHGDAIIAGELTRTSYLKMGLTVVVPYVVSVLSSVGAMAQAAKTPPRVVERTGA